MSKAYRGVKVTKRNVAIVGSGKTTFSQQLREMVLDEPPLDLEVLYWIALGYHDPEVDPGHDVGSEEISLTIESQPVFRKKPKEVADSLIWIGGIDWASDTCWLEQGGWSRTVYTKLTSEDTYKMVTTRELFSEGYVSANSSLSISVSDGSAIFAILMNISRLHRTLDTMLRLKGQAESRQKEHKKAICVLKKDTHN